MSHWIFFKTLCPKKLTWLMKSFTQTIFEKSKQIPMFENDLKIEA